MYTTAHVHMINYIELKDPSQFKSYCDCFSQIKVWTCFVTILTIRTYQFQPMVDNFLLKHCWQN